MGHVFRNEDQQMVIDNLGRFLKDKVDGLFQTTYRDTFMPREEMQKLTEQLVEFGLISGMVGEADGGLGLDWVTSMMLQEEVAACSADLSIVTLINGFGAHLLEQLGPQHLKDRYLPGLLAGKSFCSIGISEPDVGSNVLEIKARARKDGDDYIISGEKTWISNGAFSDFLICTARTGDDPRNGLTHFLIDRHEHGYEVANIHKVGLNAQSTAQIFLQDVRVPAANMIGNEGEALKNTLALFERSRVSVGASALGVARRALEEAVAYSTQRSQHGKVIAGHQLIAAMLAEMATSVDAARLLVYRAAEMIEAGVPAEMEAAMAKYFASEAGVKVSRQAVQIHGGNGVTREFLVEKLAREAMILPIPEGTSQIQQLIIGRALTGVVAF